MSRAVSLEAGFSASASHAGVSRSGWIEKHGSGLLGRWEKRFCVLSRNTHMLQYFLSEKEASIGPSAAKGSIPLLGSSLRALDSSESSDRPHRIGLTPLHAAKEYELACASADELIDWLSDLMSAGAIDSAAPRAASTHFVADSLPLPHGNGKDRRPSAAHSAPPFASLPVSERMFAPSQYEGWLLKLGGVQKKTYQSRYFSLLGTQLLYFSSFGEPESAKGAINLLGCLLEAEDLGEDHPHAFSLQPKDKPRSSLFSTLFGETLSKYILAAPSEREAKEWMSALKSVIDHGGAEPPEEGDSDGGDASGDEDDRGAASKKSNHAHSGSRGGTPNVHSPLSSSSAAAAADSFAEKEKFQAPQGDIVSHLYRLDEDGAEWKKRFAILDVKSKRVTFWKHTPTDAATLNKGKAISLADAQVAVNSDLSCAKSKGGQVLTITFPVGSSIPPLHLAPTSKARFDEWWSFLLLTLGKRRGPSLAATAAAAAAPAAAAAAAPASASKPPRTPKHSAPVIDRVDSTSAATATATAIAAAAPLLPQAQLLADMGAALNDDAAMDHFRSRSVELHKGQVTTAQYFRSYFRMFGKTDGVRFWTSLLAILPRDEVREEMCQLFREHAHLFAPDDGSGGAHHHEHSSADSESSEPLSPSFRFAPPTSPGPEDSASPPQCTPSPPPKHAQFPSFGETTLPVPVARASPAAVPSPAPAVPAPPHDPALMPAFVSAWNLRGEGNIITLLCTLHECLPELCAPGAFIPPLEEGYPTLREVKSTYFRAMLVIHPDKCTGAKQHVQQMAHHVLQAISASWEKYERKEKKKAAKAAAATAE